MAKTEKTENADKRRVMTPTARGSYLHIFKPTTFKNKTSYSATLLFDKDETDMKPLIRAKNAALREKFGDDKTQWPDRLDNPIRDGDKPKYASKEGYKGHWIVKASASEEFKPKTFDKKGAEIIDARGLVSGDYIRAQVYAIAWDTAGNCGASFLLDGVQLVKKGEPLSARGALKFDPISGGDDEDEDDSDNSNDDDDDSDSGDDSDDDADEVDFT